jgi:hypothetical protein
LRSRRCRRPGRAKIERWRCRYPAAGVPEGLGSGGTDAPLRGGRTGLSNARVDAARGAQHGAAMIAEGLKVVCVQRVDEGHIVESALGHPARRPNPRPPRDFGNSVDHEKSVRPFKGIFCRDISEFESYMPSHAVRSLWLIYGTSKNARHSTRLARLKRARPRAGAWRSPERSAPFRDRRRICWGCVAHRGPGRVDYGPAGGRVCGCRW